MTTSCEQIQQKLPEYWAGIISVNEHRAVDTHLAACQACRNESAELGRLWANLDRVPVEAPGPAVRTRFYDMLDAYRSGADEKAPAAAPSWWSRWFGQPLPVFAGALAMLAVGFFAARSFYSPPVVKPETSEIAQLRGEVNSIREMLQQQSASERLKGVTFASRADKSDRDVVFALLDTVKSDPNVNVRLAAVDAFKRFGTDHAARRQLLEAIKLQESPMVQIAIIELLVDLNDQSAVKALNAMTQDDKLQKAVQERARWAVTELH
ncbi:hypothetical protein F183_A39620 [Bryobacterales bacterium F-183]|nr:hypothetical protein F183_A39620 [Bryobacterales bacterium F-183]